MSANHPRVHFGLAQRRVIDSLQIAYADKAAKGESMEQLCASPAELVLKLREAFISINPELA
jgi:ASPIC and UnbV